MRCRFSGTDNPNPLFITAVGIGVNDQHDQHGLDQADRMPSLLTVFKSIRHDDMERIVEHLLGEIETDTVLGKISPSLLRIPFEPHIRTLNYNYVRTVL